MAMRSQTVRAFPYGVVLLLTACGGGGGNGGSSSGGAGGGGSTVTGTGFAPSTGPGDTAGDLPAAGGGHGRLDCFPAHPQARGPPAGVSGAVHWTQAGIGGPDTRSSHTRAT